MNAAHASLPIDSETGVPLVDLHAHLEGMIAVDRAVEIARQRGVRLGIVEHGGRGWHLEEDAALNRYLDSLEGYPVWKGMQAEGLDWPTCFTPTALAGLDYVLSDALSFPERDGHKVRLWESGVRIDDVQDFMDRYVEWNVRVIAATPLNIMANPTFLPACIVDRYDELWTTARIDPIIEAAVAHGVAIEINDCYNIPSLPLIRRARDAGARFSFGSNQHGAEIARIGYCLHAARACKLGPEHIFLPKQEKA